MKKIIELIKKLLGAGSAIEKAAELQQLEVEVKKEVEVIKETVAEVKEVVEVVKEKVASKKRGPKKKTTK